MSQKAQSQSNKSKIDEIKQNVRQDKRVDDTVDRARMSWILDLVLNQKTQQEIVKDIADGILNFKEIEDIFPWKFVQQLRQYTPEQAQNYVDRFKNMTDERIKGLLTLMLRRKSHEEILKLITDYSYSLDSIQKSYLRCHLENKEEGESSVIPNVSTSLEKCSLQDASNIDVKNSKESKDVGTKKKRNSAKKGETDAADTKKKGKNVEKVPKKVRVVKSKNEKRVGDIKGGNKEEGASKEIVFNPLARVDDGKALGDLTESLIRSHYERFGESTQGDQAAYKSPVQRDTKKTAKSKSLANDDAKLAGAKKASKKVGRDVKAGTRNKRKGEVENLASFSRNDDYIEEKDKPKSDESDVENENARTSYAMENDVFPETSGTERFEDSLQKSRTSEDTNITSVTSEDTNITSVTSEQQNIHGYKENEFNRVQDSNCNIQLETSTPKKLNCETKTIRIKEEPQSECSFNEFDYPIEKSKEKVLNVSTDGFKKTDFQKLIRTKRSNTKTNRKPSNTGAYKVKKVTGSSKITKAKNNRSREQKETATGGKAKDTRRKERTEDKWTKLRRLDRTDRRQKEKIRRREKKMQKAMAQFSNQVAKIVKQMGYHEKDDESSSSSNTESSYSSSYSSSSDFCSCSSCSCCSYSSSDEYSEYTLCSCSNCSSSYSNSDSDYDVEE